MAALLQSHYYDNSCVTKAKDSTTVSIQKTRKTSINEPEIIQDHPSEEDMCKL